MKNIFLSPSWNFFGKTHIKDSSFWSRHFSFKVAAILIFFSIAGISYAASQPLVSTEWLKQNLNDSKLIIVDARKTEAYEKGHIENSVSAPYSEFGWREKVDGVIGKLPPLETINQRIGSLGITPESHVVILSDGLNGSDIGSAIRIYWTLKVLGHQKTSVLNGGFEQWIQDEGKRVSGKIKTENVANTSPYRGKINQDLLAGISEVEKGKNTAVLVDARPDNQHFGYQKHPASRVGGAIPNSSRLPQHELFASEGKQTLFKDSQSLKQVAAKYDLALNEPQQMITYCNTGHWAATSWFALSELMGVENVSLYDGSWVEWSQNESRPVANEKSGLQLFWYNLVN